MIRKHITVSGSVQGVGFRYRASYAAKALHLTGWVKNEADGCVTMELQGDADAVSRLIPMVAQGTWISIDRQIEQELQVLAEERDFRIIG